MAEAGEDVYRYRWVALGVSFLAFTMAYVGRFNVPPLAPFMMSNLGITRTEIGLLMTAYSLPVILVSMPSGWLVDRFGVRVMLVYGQLILGVFTLAITFTNTFPQIFLLRLLSGIGLGCLIPSTTKAILVWFPTKERSVAMGIKQTGTNIGGVVCALTLPILATFISWKWGFIVTGITSIASSIIALTFYREAPKRIRQTGVEGSHPASKKVYKIYVNRDITIIAFASLCFAVTEFSLITYIVVYVKETLLTTAVFAGIFLALTEGAGAFGKPFFGFVSDRLSDGRRKPVFVLTGAITSVCCALIMLTPSTAPLPLFLLLFFICGLTGIGWGGLYLTLTGELAGRERAGVATGYSIMIVLVGSTLGPPIFGYIVDSTHTYILAWLYLLITSIIGTTLAALVREEKRRI